MSCRGVHFALTDKEAAHFRSFTDEQARLDHLQEVIEETYFGDHPDLKAKSDKAWDAMHRTLTDGQLTWDGGEYPLSHQGVRDLYSRAAKEGRFVLFTADQ